MRVSRTGRQLITALEGVRFCAYKDQIGLLTIGVGHLLTKSELSSGKIHLNGVAVQWGHGLTPEQVDELLAQDLMRFEAAVAQGVKVDLHQNQFDALVSFAFNVGEGAFRNSTLLKMLNRGEYAAVPAQMRRWVYAGGRKLKGLAKRREQEIKMWSGLLNAD